MIGKECRLIVGGLLALLGGGCVVAGIIDTIKNPRPAGDALFFYLISGVTLAIGLGVLAGGYRLMKRPGDGGGPLS